MMKEKIFREPIKALYLAQFLSAFVDNMILFIAVTMIKKDGYPDYYLPFIQSTFLAAFILLSPWVGRFSDKHPKVRVLIIGNIVKATGIVLMFSGFDPAFSYAVVGVGAVIYSPAKYGILPLLTGGEAALLKANAKLESYTILAILLGSVAGGFLSDYSVTLGLVTSFLLYMASIGVNTWIPTDEGDRSITFEKAIYSFIRDSAALIQNPRSHYALIGCASFWMSSAVLRMIILAWIPLTLSITSGTSISMIVAMTGIGIVFGALLTPRVVPGGKLYKTIGLGLGLALSIFSFIWIHQLTVTIGMLLLVGIFGGIYIVPMNTTMQQVGEKTIGTGKSIAVQNFVENVFMFIGVGAYTLASKATVAIHVSIFSAGMILLLMVGYLFLFSRQSHGEDFKNSWS